MVLWLSDTISASMVGRADVSRYALTDATALDVAKEVNIYPTLSTSRWRGLCRVIHLPM